MIKGKSLQICDFFNNNIYLIYTAVLFLLGVAFYIIGEFNRGEKPDLPDPNMIGKEEEEESWGKWHPEGFTTHGPSVKGQAPSQIACTLHSHLHQ